MWIFIAFASSLFFGAATILDNFLTNRLFKNVLALVFFGFCVDLILLPVVGFIAPPQFPPINLLPFIVFVGFLEIAYLFPYYKALQHDDTSVVSSLFALGRIFVPIFAFFFINETLLPSQYLGFFLVIVSSTFLTIKDIRHFRFNKSFFYMVLVSIILALDTVTYKYILGSAQWSGTYISVVLCSWCFSLLFLFNSKVRQSIWTQIRESKSSFKFLGLEEFMNVIASTGGVYVLSLVPVTLARGITSITPFVVLFYGVVLQKFFPKIFHENVDKKSIFKKIFLFMLTVVGVFLIIRNQV